jgi:hypothetical protein
MSVALAHEITQPVGAIRHHADAFGGPALDVYQLRIQAVGEVVSYTKLYRSEWYLASGTFISASAASIASSITSGPQMKYS